MIRLLCTIVLCFISVLQAHADTHYVCGNITACNSEGGSGWSGTPSDSGTCGSKTNPCLTIKYGIGQMTASDELVIGNGTYTGLPNMMSTTGGNTYSLIPDGSSGNYTTIRAENDFSTVVDGESTNCPVNIAGNSYIKFKGIHFKNGPNGGGSGSALVRIYNSDHCYLKNLITEESYGVHILLLNPASYHLVEDCFAFGMGTYYMCDSNYGHIGSGFENTGNIFRRCVVRRDAHYFVDGGNHYASFAGYQNNGVFYFQNCISVDGIINEAGDAFNGTRAVFFGANGYGNMNISGSIGINDQGQVGQHESGATNVNYSNTTVLMYPSLTTHGILFYGNNCTIANTVIRNGTSSADWAGQAVGQVSGTTGSITNSIFYGNRYGLQSVSDGYHDYNNLYANTANYTGCSQAAHEILTNPLTTGLLYPVRIESASTLKGAGSGGGQIGPTILNKIGTDGSHYGDPGWNSDTGVSLWPFPNESTIKTKMAAYNLHSVTGARGFATGTSIDGSAQTLTKYIWEYLGNQIPSDIYGTTTAPTLSGVSSPGFSVR